MNEKLTEKRMAEYVIVPYHTGEQSSDYSMREIENNIVDWMEDIMNRYVSDNLS
jgi:hypothetical protein